MSQLFVSDLHLDQSTPVLLESLKQLLTEFSSYGEEVYLLGDLVDVWIGDDDDSDFANQLRSTLRPFGQRLSLNLMHGNRDFLMGNRFASDIQATLLNDPTVIEIRGESFLLSHGDKYCTSDHSYMKMRSMYRDAGWQSDFLDRSLEDRKLHAKHVREQSQRLTQMKSESITDVVEEEIVRDLKEHNCQTLIHGHTHRPGHHRMTDNLERYTLGAWERCGWKLISHPSLSLECFPFSGKPL